MANKKVPRIKFDIADSEEDDEPVNRRSSKKSTSQVDSKAVRLVEFLNTREDSIVKTVKNVRLDDEERSMLDRLNHSAVDIDSLLRLKEPKAKDKLWKIPYEFRENKPLFEEGQEPSTINRFGTGISDGCKVSLSLPIKTKKIRDWEDIEREAEEALEAFEMAKMSRLNRTRRGSILQPTHVFLTPNPETGHTEHITGRSFLPERAWQSELQLDSVEEDQLIGVEFKERICENVSMDNLDNIPFADATSPVGEFTEADIKFMQVVQNRRRASLMPPRAGGAANMAFQRASFAGGVLWSPNLERARKKAIYHEKVKLINPDYKPPDEDSDSDVEPISDQQVEYNEVEEYYPEMNLGNLSRTKLFANELTLIVREHFVAIKESEIVNYITHSGQNIVNSCPNIKALLHFQNRIIRLVSTYILKHNEVEERVGAILFFIETIRQLYIIGNWHSVNLIAQSLQCPPVVRLKESWRRITFGYPEFYSYFVEISENLRMGKELAYYEILNKYIPIFDDVLDKIREKCGLKLIRIQQFREKTNWSKTAPENSAAGWVDQEIKALKERTPELTPKTKKKESFLDRLKKKLGLNKSRAKLKNEKYEEPEDVIEKQNENDLDENSNHRIQLLEDSSLDKLTSCKRFWSLGDYNKLQMEDKDLIKQEIVRTMVFYQKKSFFIFEDRDPELRDFLLNCRCESMNANMKRSREVENENTQRAHTKARVSNLWNDSPDVADWSSPTVLGVTELAPEEKEQLIESRHRSRRVMFAQDFNENDDEDVAEYSD